MRFIGNKTNLVAWIYAEIQQQNIEGKRFFDVFAGTTSVGRFFKTKGFQVVSSDVLYFSYVLQKAYLENNEAPQFKQLLPTIKVQTNQFFLSKLEIVIAYLNQLEGKEGFIYDNYTPQGTKDLAQPRMYFINENGKKIDAIRQQIEEWKQNNLLLENEYFILLAVLIESVPFYANILGVYAAFKKNWDARAIKPLQLKPFQILESQQTHFAFNQNSLSLLDKFEYDIIYLDPPYNQRQYAPNYHLLETIAKYDNPIIKGVSGMRNYAHQKSNFCNKDKAIVALEKILASKNYKYLMLSYNSEGIMPQEAIMQLMNKYGTVNLVEYDYLRFKSNNKGKAKYKKYIKEQLYVLKKTSF
ncbi:MAG: DNA adenine methylase [Chitinophagales bacterium]